MISFRSIRYDIIKNKVYLISYNKLFKSMLAKIKELVLKSLNLAIICVACITNNYLTTFIVQLSCSC